MTNMTLEDLQAQQAAQAALAECEPKTVAQQQPQQTTEVSTLSSASMMQQTLQDLNNPELMTTPLTAPLEQSGAAKYDAKDILDQGSMFAVEALLTSTLAKKLTGNWLLGSLVGGAGTILLRQMDILPKSVSGIHDYIQNLTSYFNGDKQQSESQQEQAVAQMKKMDKDVQNLQDGFQKTTGLVTLELGRQGSADIKAQMQEGGRLAASSDALYTAGVMDETTLLPLSQMMQANMDVFAKKTSQGVGPDGQMSESMKQDLLTECKALQDGFMAYQTAAKEQIDMTYGHDEQKKAQALEGLSRVMDAEVAPFYQTMGMLNDKYQFLPESELGYFAGLQGVPSYQDRQTHTAAVSGDQPMSKVMPMAGQPVVNPNQTAVGESVPTPMPTPAPTPSSREIPEICTKTASDRGLEFE